MSDKKSSFDPLAHNAVDGKIDKHCADEQHGRHRVKRPALEAQTERNIHKHLDRKDERTVAHKRAADDIKSSLSDISQQGYKCRAY